MSFCRAFTALLAIVGFLVLPTAVSAQGLSRWFLAEGANNALFTGEILIGNPGQQDLDVTVRLLPQPDAVLTQPVSKTFPLNKTSRLTVRLGADFGLNGSASAEVTAVVRGTATPADIVVERTMYFPDGSQPGGHNASGVTQAASTWILAEGATTAFDTFVLVANPNASPTKVRATYLTATGQEFVSEQQAAANSRATFWPRAEHPALASAEFSTVIQSLTPGNDVVAERAMYFDYPHANAFARSGHDALGVSAPSTTWYFAEGNTGGNAAIAFETFLLLANQNSTDTSVTVTFQLDTGEALSRVYVVPARQRFTVWVDQEGRLYDSKLENAAFGMTVQATQPIVAERAVYWGTPSASDPLTPQQPWAEGHATAGAPAAAAKWAFGEGVQDYRAGSPNRHQTFLLLANPNPTPIVVRATFLREDGTGIQRERCVPGNGRTNIWTADFIELSNRQFASVVESVASSAAGPCGTATAGGQVFVAERAVYWGTGFAGGHVNMGTPWTGTVATPAAPVHAPSAVVVGNEVTSGPQTVGRLSGGEWVLIDVANVATDVQVFFDGRPSPSVQFVSATRVRALTPVRTASTGYGTAGTKSVTVSSLGKTVTAAGSYTFVFRVLAIGDSFTEGLIVERIFSTPPQDFYYAASPPYPGRLQSWLSGDPQLGSGVVVANEGRGGECASMRWCSSNPDSGASRIQGLVTNTRWDAVIIMEGFNDLNNGATLGSTIDAVRYMGNTARASGATPIIGILEPTMLSLSGALASMADQEGFARHTFRNIELGGDDVHPTQAGYNQMADEMYAKLKDLFREGPPTQP